MKGREAVKNTEWWYVIAVPAGNHLDGGTRRKLARWQNTRYIYAKGTTSVEVQVAAASKKHCFGTTTYLNMELDNFHGDHIAVFFSSKQRHGAELAAAASQPLPNADDDTFE